MQKLFKHDRLLLALLFSSGCCILLLLFRVYWSGKLTYIFLPGNLFLAWLPFLFSLYLPKENAALSLKVLLLLMCWLLFFPNAPYVITDLVHLKPRPNSPYWFDIVLLTSFAWNSLVLGFVSLLKIQAFLENKLKPYQSWFLISGTLVLSSFGIYLGRFQRWNSWDIVARPVSLFTDILDKMLHPLAEPRALGMTAVFSVFLFASYLTFYFLVSPEKRLGGS